MSCVQACYRSLVHNSLRCNSKNIHACTHTYIASQNNIPFVCTSESDTSAPVEEMSESEKIDHEVSIVNWHCMCACALHYTTALEPFPKLATGNNSVQVRLEATWPGSIHLHAAVYMYIPVHIALVHVRTCVDCMKLPSWFVIIKPRCTVRTYGSRPVCASVCYSNICSTAAFWLKISVFSAITSCFLDFDSWISLKAFRSKVVLKKLFFLLC